MLLKRFALSCLLALFACSAQAEVDWGFGAWCRNGAGFDHRGAFNSPPKKDAESVIEDCQRAIKEYPDNPLYKAYLGRVLYTVQRNAEARQWIEQAQGTKVGQALMGVTYDFGIGVGPDPALAAKWYLKAATPAQSPDPGDNPAKSANTTAMINLAILYRDGRGVPQHHGQAAEWFRKAADLKDSYAQVQLGKLLEAGLGVRQDRDQAENRYRQAAKQGNELAYAALEKFYQAHPDMLRKRQDSGREAAPGAFCACDEPDAFPGSAKLFNSIQLHLIQETYETLDPRQKIDRTAPRFKPLNAIGQVVVLDEISGKITEVGFGTGILLPGNLVLTNAHVIKREDTYVRFNIGQTEPDAPNRWADSIIGKVITLGSSIGSIPEDWALIQLDTSKVNWNKKYGSIMPSMLNEEGFQKAGQRGLLTTAGYPGFKDPRYLWGQTGVQLLAEEDSKGPKIEPSKLNAATSSGMSGGAVLYEYQPGQFKLVGLVRGGSKDDADFAIMEKRYSFYSDNSNFTNFKHPLFSENFGVDYKRILKGTF